MKCLTIRQPYASLVAAGVKTIEMRSWRTNYRGRIAIHAAASDETWEEIWRDAHERPGTAAQVVDAVRRANPWWTGAGWYADYHGVLADSWFTDACDEPPALLPLGAVVATAELVDCVPMERIEWCDEPSYDGDREWVLAAQPHADVSVARRQVPFGVFEPGRWAWLLDDIKPVNERCPACWGDGVAEGEQEVPCPMCAGFGACGPVPARGQQGLWEWEP